MSQVDLKEKLYIKTKGVVKTLLCFLLQSVYENFGHICYVEPNNILKTVLKRFTIFKVDDTFKI